MLLLGYKTGLTILYVHVRLKGGMASHLKISNNTY